jgi:uncharacterized protein
MVDTNDKNRKLYSSILDHLQYKEFTIITGARQTGKSTLLYKLHNYLRSIDELTFSFSFEDPILLDAINEHPEKIFDYIPKPTDKRIYLEIDEVQYANNPSNFLKLLYDKYAPNLKIIATGSSAFYLDTKFKDSLAGRKQIFELYTLDFDEFIDFKTNDSQLIDEMNQIRTNPNFISYRRQELLSLYNEYITWGGYPAVVLAPNNERKNTLLKELINTYIKRDIYESRIQDEEKFYNLLTILANQVGGLVNTNELANTLKISVTAVDNYLYVMQKTFHIRLVRPFYNNVRKELSKMPKVFFNDLGLRNAIISQYNPINQRADKSQITENLTYIRLRQLNDLDNIRYWRTADGNEVDFVVKTAYNEGFAIECKYSNTEFKATKYKKFTENYPQYQLNCWAFEAEGNNSIFCK